jgi:hypothetical protein
MMTFGVGLAVAAAAATSADKKKKSNHGYIILSSKIRFVCLGLSLQ